MCAHTCLHIYVHTFKKKDFGTADAIFFSLRLVFYNFRIHLIKLLEGVMLA